LSAGHEVAKEQFLVQRVSVGLFSKVSKKGKIKLKSDKGKIIYLVTGTDFEVIFTKEGYGLQSIKYDGVEMLNSPLEMNFWRAPVDNDLGAWKADKKEDSVQFFIFREAANEFELKDFTYSKTRSKSVKFIYTFYHTNLQATNTLTYEVNTSGAIHVSAKMIADSLERLEYLPRYGVSIELDDEYNKIEYYGRGPFENYIDRKFSSHVGRYTASAEDFYVPYIRPQENGYRTDSKELKLTNDQGKGLQISSLKGLGFSVQKNPQSDFDNTFRHSSDIDPTDIIYLTIDHAQIGVGGNNSWHKSGLALPHYRIDPEKCEYSFSISPIKNPLKGDI